MVAGNVGDERGNQFAAAPDAAVADEQRRYDLRKSAIRGFLRSVTRRVRLRLPGRKDLTLVAYAGIGDCGVRAPASEVAQQFALRRLRRGGRTRGGCGKKACQLVLDDFRQPAPRRIVDCTD